MESILKRLPRAKSDTDMAKISVIVPVYNVEKDVQRCIESILSQRCCDFEIIIVNDGTPDKSGEICKKLAEKNPQIRYFEKENGGLASARNYGLERAEGEYICCVDSDDFIDDGAFRFYLDKIEETDADMAVFGYYMQNGEEVSEISAKEGVYEGDEIFSALTELKAKNLIDPAWNKIYKADFLRKNNMRFPEGEIYEDTDFNLRLLRFSPKIAVFSECFYRYVLHTGSITRRYNPEKLATIKKRALLLKEVSKGMDSYCDFYYVKCVFSAVMDMFLSFKKSEIKKEIEREIRDENFINAAKNAEYEGRQAKMIVNAAKSLNVNKIYRFCRLSYVLKFKMQRLFLKVRL